MKHAGPDLKTLQALPKVELHRHLEGSMRPETLWEFHGQQRQTLHSSIGALRAACTIPEQETPGFRGFLARFDGLRFMYGGPDALERIAAEAVEDAADDGVVHLELRFSPVFYARRLKPAGNPAAVEKIEDVEEAADAIVRGARREAERRGISISFIITLARHFGAAVNRPAADLLRRPVGAALAGLDLAGDEAHPAKDFAILFKKWKAAGRGLTVHAGEDPSGDATANITEAIRSLKAGRIGHGVRASDPELLRRLAQSRVTLEMCPTSNVQTQACASFEKHPLRAFLDNGLAATINTDDPAISQTTLSREYQVAVNRCGLTWYHLRECAMNAARAAFLPLKAREALVERIDTAWQNALPHREAEKPSMRED